MKKSKAVSAIGLLTVLMVFGFQNCSKVGVEDMSSVNGKLATDGDGAVIDPSDDSPSDDSKTPDIAVGEPMPGKDRDKDHDKDCDKDKDKDDMAKMPTETDLRALCLKEKSSGVAGPVVEQLRGIVVVESDVLERVEDIRGTMVIRGKTAGAKLKLLRNIRGAVVVCGMEVEDVDDTRGQLVLVNSKAAHVNNVRGNINLIESEIGDLQDFRGVIKEDGKPAKAI